MIITPAELQRRHIRRSQYVPCDDAFIDVRLPGSAPKENFSIIGPGVTQSASQFVNLREPHGFNIGAAGLAPGITNNLHLHFTAEVFIVCEGRFRLHWGVDGNEGGEDAVLEEGDVICMPTWMFRGFSNSGTRPGFLMTVLGGDDTGGIIWSPQVMQRARATGLWLGRDNQIIEVAAGQAAPPEDSLLPLMPADEVQKLRHWNTAQLMARAVKHGQRHFAPATLDTVLPGHAWQLAPVIGWGLSQANPAYTAQAAVQDPQGFSIEWLRVPPGQRSAPFKLAESAVLVHASGPLSVAFNSGAPALDCALGAWDTLSMPGGAWRQFINTGTEAAEALLVVHGDQRKTPHFAADVHAHAALLGTTLDAGGRLARLSLLPPAMLA
jgi:mannose-6-phosphate isomerase-like protein (cupin superfamily)